MGNKRHGKVAFFTSNIFAVWTSSLQKLVHSKADLQTLNHPQNSVTHLLQLSTDPSLIYVVITFQLQDLAPGVRSSCLWACKTKINPEALMN